MGCNCGGSQAQASPEGVDQQRTVARDNRLTNQPEQRPGGPGEPGYVWNGPQGNQTPETK